MQTADFGETAAKINTVSLVDCDVSFDGLAAVSGVSLDLRRAEITSLIGPNGAGKTTLINVLSGFQRPTRGRVRFDQKDVTRLRPRKRARLGLSRSFQGLRLFPRLTALENIELGALGVGSSTADARSYANELLDQTGLVSWGQRVASELPLGIERRVGVLRALAARPSVLLLDEPAAGLNNAESQLLGEFLVSVRSEYGCGLLLVEHDMDVVFAVSDVVHVLDHGQLIATGAPDVVAQDPAVLTAYLGPAVGGF